MPKQKIKLTKKERLQEKQDKDIWWKDSSQNSKKAMAIIAVLIFFVMAIGLTSVLFNQKNKLSQKETEKIKQELEESKKKMRAETDLLREQLEIAQKELAEAQTEKETAEKANQKVTIEGSLSYPSNYIPGDMEICAQDLVNTSNLICTKNHINDKNYTYGVGYKLEVAPGGYNVYATVPNWQGYKAYYSDFVTCGLKYGCASHEPIKVTAEPDKNLSNIDPIDWYKQ